MEVLKCPIKIFEGSLERDVGWRKRKLEGKQKGSSKVLNVLPLCTAVGAAIIALIALLT